MARTTLDLDPTVLAEIRRRASRESKSMGQVASELLAGAVRAGGDDLPAPAFEWTAERLGEPVVDLEDPEAVRRALDGDR